MNDWYNPPRDALAILHVDRDMVAIDKPSGLLSVPGREPGLADSAQSRVVAAYGTAWPAHRLDMDTSGVLLFALRRKAEAELQRQFRERLVRKTYVARVSGHPTADSGRIDRPLMQEEGQPRSRIDPAGRPAVTRWQVLRRDPDGTALLKLHPETGRPHQLRVHLCAIGHPIVGDRFYAPPEIVALAPRLLLHAQTLEVRHPYRGDLVRIEAQTPF